jgi:hypothetical protein
LSEFNLDASTPRKRRVDKFTTSGGGVTVPYTYVWPLTSTVGSADSSQNPPSLRRVAGSCTSEFYVEYLSWDNSGDYKWKRGFVDIKRHLPFDINGTATTIAGGCPRAIRVTVAIHDPDDRKPLTAGVNRFQGYALQEVYWIRDP